MSRPHRPQFRSAVIALAAVAALSAGCGSATAGPERLPAIETIQLVVDRSGAGEGGTVLLDSIGGPAVINVWATTCAPCVREMPALESVSSSHPEVDFYGLNVAESPEAVSEFVDRLGVTYPQLLDPQGFAQDALEIDSLPTTFILDAAGEIVVRHRGEITAESLEDALTQTG